MFSCWEWETSIAVAMVVPLLIAFGWGEVPDFNGLMHEIKFNWITIQLDHTC